MMPEIPDRLTIPEPIPETRLIPRPPTFGRKLAAVLDWKMTMDYRPHKIGGEPDWIQGEETPERCDRRTMFYGQLGSLGGKYDLCDNGIIYIFICRKCLKTHSILQFS